jgi:poly(3-hydroxybutyrate) depolymerase
MKISHFLPITLAFASLSLAASGCSSESGDGLGDGGAPNNSTGGSVNNGTGGAVNNGTGGSANSGTGGSANNPSGGAGNDASGGNANNASGGSDNGDGDSDAVDPSAGCGQAAPAAGNATIDVDGLMREYILALPENYDPDKPYKLIFTWHPWGGSAQQVAGNGPSGYYGLLGASEGEAIFVSPEGLDFGGNGLGWGNEGGQDIAFLEAMMARFDSELCFDHNRVFSTGFSFGGMMSNAVACAGLARAVAPMAGNSGVSGCANGETPVAYMGFHGTEDTVVDISGGQMARDVFIQRNKCGDATPSDSNWCELAGSNRQPCTCTTYEGCTAGYPVTWCEYNGTHMVAPNSAQTIWDFFAQF